MDLTSYGEIYQARHQLARRYMQVHLQGLRAADSLGVIVEEADEVLGRTVCDVVRILCPMIL